MPTTANPFDSKYRPRRHPPLGRNRNADRSPRTGQQAGEPWSRKAIAICLPRIERIAGHSGCGDHLVARSSWGQDAPGILVLSHLDTVHPLGFIERLPFKIEGDSAFGPGIYDMKGGAYLAYHAFRATLRDGRAFAARRDPALRLGRGNRQPDLARADRGRGTQGKICAGDRACARRRENRHRAQGRRAVRGFCQRRPGPRRHAGPRTAAARSANSPISFKRWKR